MGIYIKQYTYPEHIPATLSFLGFIIDLIIECYKAKKVKTFL